MVRPDVVDYLRQTLPKFKLEDLRRQLETEGVSERDFEDSLEAALSKKAAPSARKPNPAALLLGVGVALIAGAALFAVSQKGPAEPRQGLESAKESGFIGRGGWVVRLPKDYVAVSEFKDQAKTDQLVHFCKRGTDPTNFLDEGLFGPLGIVRLEVTPSPFPPNPAVITALSDAVSRKTTRQGEKFLLKNITVGALPGVQLNVQAPFPRVEAYLLGRRDLYFFYGGQDDDVWRDIVQSLRDPRAEE